MRTRLMLAAVLTAAILLAAFITPTRSAAWSQPTLASTGASAVATVNAAVAEATGIVMAQLDAFRRGDFDAAYTFASAMIRGMFDRAAFERMVRAGYPEIARSSAAHVTSSRSGSDATLYLIVKIRGENGAAIEALYELVREEGSFRINGVVTRPDDGISASASDSSRRTSSAGSEAPPKRTRS
jgi:hypothetical protein